MHNRKPIVLTLVATFVLAAGFAHAQASPPAITAELIYLGADRVAEVTRQADGAYSVALVRTTQIESPKPDASYRSVVTPGASFSLAWMVEGAESVRATAIYGDRREPISGVSVWSGRVSGKVGALRPGEGIFAVEVEALDGAGKVLARWSSGLALVLDPELPGADAVFVAIAASAAAAEEMRAK